VCGCVQIKHWLNLEHMHAIIYDSLKKQLTSTGMNQIQSLT